MCTQTRYNIRVKTTSIREFRARLAEFLEDEDPLLVKRHARNVAIVYPLRHPANIPVEVRREIVDAFARGLDVRPEWLLRSPLIDAYKRHIDRTLIRENLRRTPEERLQALQAMQRFAAEIRRP